MIEVFGCVQGEAESKGGRFDLLLRRFPLREPSWKLEKERVDNVRSRGDTRLSFHCTEIAKKCAALVYPVPPLIK